MGWRADAAYEKAASGRCSAALSAAPVRAVSPLQREWTRVDP